MSRLDQWGRDEPLENVRRAATHHTDIATSTGT